MLKIIERSDGLSAKRPYFPPAPKPQPRPLGTIALILTLNRNPLECWAAPHFERPIVAGGLPFGHVLLVHEPGAIRRVLRDNAPNYRKDRFQRRVLSAGLNDGLLSAEGERWRLQRRIIAPMFARRTVMDFAPAMMAAAQALIDRWTSLGDRATIDVAAEMAAGRVVCWAMSSSARATATCRQSCINTIGSTKSAPRSKRGLRNRTRSTAGQARP